MGGAQSTGYIRTIVFQVDPSEERSPQVISIATIGEDDRLDNDREVGIALLGVSARHERGRINSLTKTSDNEVDKVVVTLTLARQISLEMVACEISFATLLGNERGAREKLRGSTKTNITSGSEKLHNSFPRGCMCDNPSSALNY